jgi:hypothetical protein
MPRASPRSNWIAAARQTRRDDAGNSQREAEATMPKLTSLTEKKGKSPAGEKRATFGVRKVEPRLESAFVFPAEKHVGLKLYGGKKSEKPVPKKS